MDKSYHEMIFEKTHDSGVEEWYCPICGRRFLVQWPPAYKMIVLEPGDKDIQHNLSKVNSRQATQDTVEEFRLLPWLKWMEKVNFESLWGASA
jgi:hypothetical protein